MNTANLDHLIEGELRYFETDEQRRAFHVSRISHFACSEQWQYGAETHRCTVVASDGETQIVHCLTGFGPSFPWSVQRVGESDLGMDSQWFAYLYEAFICSTMWPHGVPEGFTHMGPGERGTGS